MTISFMNFESNGITVLLRLEYRNVPTIVSRARSRTLTTTPSGLRPRLRDSIRVNTRSPSIAVLRCLAPINTSLEPESNLTKPSPARVSTIMPDSSSTFSGTTNRWPLTRWILPAFSSDVRNRLKLGYPFEGTPNVRANSFGLSGPRFDSASARITRSVAA